MDEFLNNKFIKLMISNFIVLKWFHLLFITKLIILSGTRLHFKANKIYLSL